MTISDFIDFANEANDEIGRYKLDDVILSPSKLTTSDFTLSPLIWNSIKYGPDEVNQVPDDRRGIYAFVLQHPSNVLPPHGYVLYIGIAGRKSDRSLRARYRDYLNAKAVVKSRPHIARMIGTWKDVLKFYFAPIDDGVTGEDLEKMERELNTALMPPFSKGDLDAKTKKMRSAF